MSSFVKLGGIFIDEGIVNKSNITDDNCEITLKQGTRIEFKVQPDDRFAEISQTIYNRIDFKGLLNAVIIDTEDNDVYRLMGCEDVSVYADRGVDSDLIEVYHRILPNKDMQYSRNNTLKLNSGDLYKLPDDSSIKFISEDSENIKE